MPGTPSRASTSLARILRTRTYEAHWPCRHKPGVVVYGVCTIVCRIVLIPLIASSQRTMALPTTGTIWPIMVGAGINPSLGLTTSTHCGNKKRQTARAQTWGVISRWHGGTYQTARTSSIATLTVILPSGIITRRAHGDFRSSAIV